MAQGKGVYKRGNVWWLAFADAAGRSVRETSGTSDYKAALKKLAEQRDKVAKGKEVSKAKVRNVLFSDAADEYLKWAKPQRAYSNKFYMKGELVAKFGNIPLRRFNVSMLEGYQQELLASGKAAGTINRKMAMLKHLFRKANDWGWVDDDALRTVRKVKKLKEPPGRLRYLTAAELSALLKACIPALRPVVAMGAYTGMRQGEILKLKWEDVDLRNGFLMARDTKNGENRSIPLNAAAREVLSRHPRRLDSPCVFFAVKWKGKGKDRAECGVEQMKYPRWAFERACLAAGLVNFHFHDLRHTAASFMAMAGVDLMSIKQVLGHKTIQMTLRYSHLSPGHLRNAVAAIDRALTSPACPTSQFTSQSGDSPELAPEGTSATV